VCFKTSEYANMYYTVQPDNKSVKFGWKVDKPVGNKDFSIVANKPIKELTNIDWTDFNKQGLEYKIDGNTLTITNPEKTAWWFDPVINTTADVLATSYSNQRKIIQMPNGNIYTIFNNIVAQRYIVLSKSTDYGTTWTNYNLTVANATNSAYVPSMILDTNNNIRMTWQSLITNRNIVYAEWNTTSDTLIGTLNNVSGTTSATTESFNPDIAILNNGTIGIAYQRENAISANYGIFTKQCSINCLTYASWTSEQTVQLYNVGGILQNKYPDIETNGTTFFTTWEYRNSANNNDHIAFSSWNGTGWSTLKPVSQSNTTIQLSPSMIINGGNIYLTATNGNFSGIVFTKSTDWGNTWSAFTNISVLTSTDQQLPQLSTDGTNLYAVWAGTNGLNTYSEENFTTNGITYDLTNADQQYHGYYSTTQVGITQQITNDVTKQSDFALYDYVGVGTLIDIYFQSSEIKSSTTSVKTILTPAANNVYYNISLRNINWTANTTDIYVNNVLKLTAEPFQTGGLTAITAIDICNTGTASNQMTCYFDNLQMWNNTVNTTSYHSTTEQLGTRQLNLALTGH
jgi:uncharacterized ubiquitin-like protein YukD